MILSLIKWTSTADELPRDGQIVLVEGGTALYRDKEWFSGMTEPYFERPIEWAVAFWAPCHKLNEYLVR